MSGKLTARIKTKIQEDKTGFTPVSLTFIDMSLVTCHSKTNLCYGVIHTSAAETLTATRVSREPTGQCLDGHLPLGSAHGQNVFIVSCVSSLFSCHWHHALVTSEMLATSC